MCLLHELESIISINIFDKRSPIILRLKIITNYCSITMIFLY